MKGYLFINNAEIVKKSSSGGAFSAIIEVLKKERNERISIYGAAFDNSLRLVHVKYYADEDYSSLLGSKYCFSSYGHSLVSVYESLKAGEVVVFTGTPCQIFTLKLYLQNKDVDISNLVTIDLICHGSPNKKIWDLYKHWLEKKRKKKLVDFNFRYKGAKWHGYSLKAVFEDGTSIVNTHDLQAYMDLYFTHHIMRNSCYTCKFASIKRPGDITLGDFWGAGDIFPNIATDKIRRAGISLIISNTSRGDRVINYISRYANDNEWIFEKCANSAFISYQTGLNKPVNKPMNNDVFYKYLDQYGIDGVLRKYAGYSLKGRMRYVIKYLANYFGIIK